MTDNQIKEAISEAFIRLILSHDGFKIFKSEYDHGIDLTVGPTGILKTGKGETIIDDSDRRLDIQLKCTTEEHVRFERKHVEYDLRYKNYVQLKNKAESKYIKILLIVFILPEDKGQWLKIVKNQMLLRKRCFWYLPDNSQIPPEWKLKTKNSTVKILIPLKNHLLNNFKLIFIDLIK